MNKKFGFLLGAGASYELGLPLVDELTIEFKRALLRTKGTKYYSGPKEIEDILIPLLDNRSLNYEDIIGRIEVEIKRCRGNNPLYQKWHGFLGKYLEAIYYLLLERHYKNKSFINQRLHLLEPLKEFCSDNPLWIFSLNHDLLIEIIAKHLSLPIKYGFHENIKIMDYSFERLSRENMESNQFSFFQNGAGINLIKLHGSLDIFVQGDEKNYLKLVNTGSGKTDLIDDVNNLLKQDASSKQGVKCTNEITYLDDNKVLQFLRITIMSGKHKYSSMVSHTMDDWFFKIFKGHINYIQTLFSIGYSFQDLHVNSVVYDWLSFSPQRKLVIVNPGIKDIPNSFRHLMDQIEILNMTFLEFLNKNSTKRYLYSKINNKFRDVGRHKFVNENKI
ncbi:MAG TPA: hypothetical protein VJ945_09155 [Flavobacteriaceae bacterium]|nr:hypothetical protein [Flavobacteriaceae bacterium]